MFFAVRKFNSTSLLVSESFNIVYRSLLMLGCTTVPYSFRNRIVFIVILVMGMVLYWLWEAMLISYFSAANIILEFNNLEELLTKSKSKVNFKKFRFSNKVKSKYHNLFILMLDIRYFITSLFLVICFFAACSSKGIYCRRLFPLFNWSNHSKSVEKTNWAIHGW